MISEAEIKKLGFLARVGINEKEVAEFRKDLAGILDFVSTLSEIRVDARLTAETGDHSNIFREDGSPHKAAEYSGVLLEEAPSREGTYIKVKQIFMNDDDDEIRDRELEDDAPVKPQKNLPDPLVDDEDLEGTVEDPEDLDSVEEDDGDEY